MYEVMEILKSLLTPVIAIVATYIAWQQWKTNALKLKLERYDRRVHIYDEVKRLLSLIVGEADIRFDELLKFRAAVAEADFLFGSEIPKYLDENYSHAVELYRLNRKYRDINQEIPEATTMKKSLRVSLII
jgi:hypothetical protein